MTKKEFNNETQVNIQDVDKESCRRNLLETITTSIQEAFSIACETEEERYQFIKDVVSTLEENVPQKPKIDPPKKAPELYVRRKNRKEKPDEFIRRVYSKWLGSEMFTRPLIKSLDLSLYRSLYKQGIPEDFKTLLPTAKGISVSQLSKSPSIILAEKRDQARTRMQRHRSKN